jgi:putative flippase GtrA
MVKDFKGLVEKTARHPLLHQVMRFGFIGVMAAIVNFLAVVLLVSSTHLNPLWANVVAFLIAFQVSFLGHKGFTFQKHDGKHLNAMTKFFIVAGVSFALNEGLFALFLKEFHLYYMFALLLVLVIVPPFTFAFSKLWAFR